ncbi:ribosome biogenesis GTPase Der [Breznakiella homolactica]|uniref:GTPase Der n=1 Tax=Breznakiella homolactica TaxID=2798577 RepID=A0A7T7XQA2_9SPIR|nr:ribosome biogenesis GTPase Der [Breznakiella homolactica]QQO10540.1 ribosome biogenesis GTPase Der [Breznakiella homolactica]
MNFEYGIQYRNLPVVALVGRPNVGKSTLFNRLLHKRRVITDPTPGVTRDPVGADAFIANRPVRLIDTGGFKLDREELDGLVVERTLETLETADLIVLILEAGELTPEDEEFIKFLRPHQDRLMVAVNKTEGGRREADAWNLLSYGFDSVYMISAEHGDNIGDLEDAIVKRLDFSNVEVDTAEERGIRLALVGKPNTGKSTLSNRLTASAASIVSDIPGTTRDVVEGSFYYKDRLFTVLDTAGIRRKSRVNENIEYYSVNRAIKSLDDADVVLLMIDANEGLSDQDKKITALAHERGRGIIMVLNKWDTMPQIKNTFTAASDRIRFLFGKMDYAPIVAVSAIDGTGVGELLDTALKMYRQLTRKVDTGPLNQALERWLEEYPPPIGPKTRFKIKYVTQVSENPVKFVFFVSRPQAVTESYESYLRNKIRKDLGFSMIPVQIELRASRTDQTTARKELETRRALNKTRPEGSPAAPKKRGPGTEPARQGSSGPKSPGQSASGGGKAKAKHSRGTSRKRR